MATRADLKAKGRKMGGKGEGFNSLSSAGKTDISCFARVPFAIAGVQTVFTVAQRSERRWGDRVMVTSTQVLGHS